MLFNSAGYIVFFTIVCLVYFILPKKLKRVFLLMASYFFYSCWNLKYSLLMLFSTVATYGTAIAMDMVEAKKKKKLYLGLCFFVNLAILFVFKYYSFTVNFINKILGIAALSIDMPVIDVLLPVGISFYTFQALGYIVDVYRGEIKAERNFINYALFVSFFPQLVAGPIERSKNLLTQIDTLGHRRYENLSKGLLYILWGFFLKLVIADRAAIFVNQVFDSYQGYSYVFLCYGALLFVVQIYCDFYSYSIIAKGSAKVLGYDLMDNFKAPYLSASITEFWRRWHISLSTWFKDYLYIPLGGNRKGAFRKHLNVLIVFLVSGLWHGANYTFVLWGLIHGVFNILEDSFKGITKGIRDNFIYKNIRRLITFVVAVLSFVIFRSKNIGAAKAYLLGILKRQAGTMDASIAFPYEDTVILLIAIAILVVIDILIYNNVKLADNIERRSLVIRWPIYIFLLIATLIFGIYGPGYSEAQFIYFQF
ncbi:MBOAT family O-acyltransferase [Fenollaria timonensis]|uniref:MBOAT family O-acyltransferase n=1 Tax=Fenollaria timonensis TaxID=1723384 RepID=UPI00071D43E4|nr:MBOAT family O-acyltransferase [Fenollaria timonensis]